MTKVRQPLTFENALTKVAAVIGWEETARIAGAAQSTVRSWSDPDITARLPLEAAFRLDLEFHKLGGDGAPFLQCYMARVESARRAACPEIQALIAGAAAVAKETGEAIEATLNAATMSAGLADIAVAERELEDAIAAHHNSLALIRARKQALLEPGGTGGPPANSARTMEVVPPTPMTG